MPFPLIPSHNLPSSESTGFFLTLTADVEKSNPATLGAGTPAELK
jgi:hypothetical protein